MSKLLTAHINAVSKFKSGHQSWMQMYVHKLIRRLNLHCCCLLCIISKSVVRISSWTQLFHGWECNICTFFVHESYALHLAYSISCLFRRKRLSDISQLVKGEDDVFHSREPQPSRGLLLHLENSVMGFRSEPSRRGSLPSSLFIFFCFSFFFHSASGCWYTFIIITVTPSFPLSASNFHQSSSLSLL